MKKARKCLLGLVGAVCLGSIAGCGTNQSSKEINIGVSAPLTGQFAQDGKYMKQGIQLAVNDVNAKGGIGGRQIKLFFEDDQGPNPTVASNAVTKLVTQDNVVAVIGPHFSPAMLPAESLFSKYKVPALTGATGPVITAQGNPWIFRIRLNDSIGAKLLVQYAVNDLHLKRVGLDYVNTSFGQSGIQAVKQALAADGITPVDIQTHDDSTKDFTSQILSFEKAKVDGVIVWTDDQPSGLLAQQMKQLGANFKLIGSTSFSQPPFLNLAGSASNGAYAITDFTQNNPDPRIQAWESKFNSVYHTKPELYATAYYDAMNILIDALQHSSKVDAPSIQKALENIKNYQGVITNYSYSSGGDMVHAGLITQVQNGQPVVIKKVSGS
ncbi:ABC transporter substrate-binding protein [Alicyclobacillus dauci]|uniref:ABC transporter substrate-binding protein n=1 Tax=Alicyclobacillus dauci TaxID=1475485 RepID=A0ABY6YZ79_9BACL|nr:ABC transporter substrate-binding protein [Alicyclobacillus dauci]WAH35769.1 ABC transporter substrate-binding protein [Alicyclobacillus dauci]